MRQLIGGRAIRTKLSSLTVRISLAVALAWSGCAGERKVSGYGTLPGLGAGCRDLRTLRSEGSALWHEWRAAQQEVVRGDYEAAAARLRNLAQGYPQDAEVRLFLGDVLISAGRPEEALEWLTPLAAEPGRDGRVFYLAALAYDQLGNCEQALLYYEKALECDPTNEVYLASYEKAVEAFPTALTVSHR